MRLQGPPVFKVFRIQETCFHSTHFCPHDFVRMAIKYPGIDSYQIKRKKYPVRVTLSIYKQQGKLHQNGNNLVTKKQVSKTSRGIQVWCFSTCQRIICCLQILILGSCERERVNPKCLGSILVFLGEYFLRL